PMSPETQTSFGAPSGHWLVQTGGMTLLINRRGFWAGMALTLMAIVVALGSLSVGTPTLSISQVGVALIGRGDPFDVFMLQELRLPRLAAGVLSVGAVGIGGGWMQTQARNCLATSGIIGIDDGATAFAVASFVATPTSLAPPTL